MQKLTSIRQLLAYRHRFSASTQVGLVPTMGALHEGHLSLVHHARREVGPQGVVIATIFVNPAQFNQQSDLKKYPRPIQRDLQLCRQSGVDAAFFPLPEEIYPKDFSTWVEETDLARPLCGASRPGHFRGVCTVVLKLFNLIQPDVAVFGQKDAQQVAVLKRMVRDLNVPVQIKVAPIVRESDGLAMSSRNVRLSAKDRNKASVLNSSLRFGQLMFENGEQNPKTIIKAVHQIIKSVPGVKLDYLEIVNSMNLKNSKKVQVHDMLVVAAWVGGVRLIDNMLMSDKK